MHIDDFGLPSLPLAQSLEYVDDTLPYMLYQAYNAAHETRRDPLFIVSNVSLI